MTREELKAKVDSMCSMIETFGTMGGLEAGAGDNARMELAGFMMYLSASDGQIVEEEAKAVSEICGIDITTDKMSELIEKFHIYTKSFGNKVPGTFELMVAADIVIAESGREAMLSRNMLETYAFVGAALITADSDLDAKEEKDFRKYIKMLEKYRNSKMKLTNEESVLQ